ncbi:hypothetical protein V9L05_03225 [Bernardetia sp. Wsw4-3y2]
MKTNKKLKLSTKKITILSSEQQTLIKGGNIVEQPTGGHSRKDCILTR